MKVLVKKAILYYCLKFPMAKMPLLIWNAEFSKHTFSNFNELKKIYGNASIVNNNRVVFNIKGNDFRLVIEIDYEYQLVFIIWIGTHK
jgi:mRNA interferase HigB